MNRKNAWIVTAAALAVCLPVRLYQIFALSDGATGFYNDGSTVTWILSVLLAAGAALAAVMCYRGAGAETKGYRPLRSLPSAVFGVLAGLGLAVQSVVSLAADGEQNRFMYMILSCFGILAGVVLILTAYDFVTEQNHFERFPALALLPPLWGCILLVTLFVAYVSMVNVADHLFNAAAMVFVLLFLFSQAKLLAGTEREKSARMAFVFGLPAVLLCLLTGVSGTAAAFAGLLPAGSFPAGLHLLTIVFALYIAAFLAALQSAPPVKELSVAEEGAEPAAPEVAVPEQSEEKSQWSVCGEFLAGAYRSEAVFRQHTPSPFLQADKPETAG